MENLTAGVSAVFSLKSKGNKFHRNLKIKTKLLATLACSEGSEDVH